MSSRRERVGGGATFRSSHAAPSSRRHTPSIDLLNPPTRSPPKSGRRATPQQTGSLTGQIAAYEASAAPLVSTGRRSGGHTPGLSQFNENDQRFTPSARSHMSDKSHRTNRSHRSDRSRQSCSGLSAAQLEAQVNQEVADIFKKVDIDVAFNKADEQESYEARKIVQNEKPEERGVVPIMDRIRNEDLNQDGMIDEDEKFVNIKSDLALKRNQTPDPVADGSWRANFNPSLKWWQGTPVGQMGSDERKVRGLDDVSPAHPAYFCLRRKDPSLEYVEKPVYRTRSELLAMRKKCMVPDSSYDLDGDGVIGQREFYMAARLDKDASGTLTLEEKRKGLENMRQDLANVMFVDNAGKRDDRDALNQYRIIQQDDGKIILDQQ